MSNPVLDREFAYHERLYSGFAQQHFAKPAVRALRAHMVSRILKVSGAGRESRVLSVGCGIGDTEILLAPHVGCLTGIDLSPSAIRQARADSAGLTNICFEQDTLEKIDGQFDLIFAVFFLHHLPNELLAAAPRQIAALLAPGGTFYALDPSRQRLSGFAGRLLFPALMRRYQSEDERELDAAECRNLFRGNGFACSVGFYDFVSSPLAGLCPGWGSGYRAARKLDEVLLRIPFLKRFGSNLEIIASRSR
ncbi:MAG: class I SAM-dependent methyltransferase [Bryobacteraceae bacterium]